MNPTNEHERTVQNPENRTETGQSSSKRRAKLPKTHVDYWQAKLKKRVYRTNGGTREVEIPTWQVRLFHAGREGWFNLETANKAAAAVRARDVYQFLVANGWEATLAKFKAKDEMVPRTTVTVGQYLRAVEQTGSLRGRTFLNYQNCLRTLVAELFGLKDTNAKFDYRTGGAQRWQERIDSIRLERVTAEGIGQWQRRRVTRAGHSPVAIASAKRTANSYVRCARSLFTTTITRRLKGLKLPSPLPFDGVELLDAGSTKYLSKVNVGALIAAAKKELKTGEPEVYKVFLIGLFAGLRKGEIDLLEWDMLDCGKNVIRLEETRWLHLKTRDSAGEITIDPEVAEELRGFMTSSKSQFIITSDRPPRNDSARTYYRCKPIFDRLNKWLRGKGVVSNKPLHEMRKEIGALVATEHGIYAASTFLRHSDITTTARHYAEHRKRITVGLGKLLRTEIKPSGDAVQAE